MSSCPGEGALWRKAAVLGSLWAASEIVLGSFLHNARVPLTGHILTGIGIAILTAGHKLWPERGLLWRAGLVCAAMKSVSPSAVILSPMVAISMEGILLEAGVFLAGANPAGYILAGGLAMSWPLFHTLGGVFLYYGPETLAVYVRGLEQVRAWLGVPSGSAWTPLLAIWAAHLLGGALAALAGLRVSRKGETSASSTREEEQRATRTAAPWPPKETQAPRDHSLTALALHILCVAAAMSLGARLAIWAFAAAAGVYAAACVSLYARAASIMKRFSLWSGILMVSVLAGLVLSRWESGVQMGLRAVILTLGFACIGEELRNPVIRSWLERRGGRAFFDALDQAFATLPAVFAGLPPGAQLARSPLESLAAALFRAPALLG
ncbi:MAG: hypothetical protein HY922_05560, partial [Elusimicrobia bacterium]|nr:hypothetical protein [Elusimicrobiota bacterium]